MSDELWKIENIYQINLLIMIIMESNKQYTCNVITKATVGMFNWSYFDNSKLIMFDNWKVSFLRKKICFYST